MTAQVNFGNRMGTIKKVTRHRAVNYEQLTFRGVGTFSGLAGQPWMDLHAYMIKWEANRTAVEPEGLGSRLIIDLSGTKPSEQRVQIHLLDANPASFPEYSLTPASFLTHDAGNVLYHIANQITEKYGFVAGIRGHSSSTDGYFIFTDGNPSQVIHSLLVAHGPYTSALALPSDQWHSLGVAIERELEMLGNGTAIEKIGYRLEMNSGIYAQAVAQMHAHLKAGNLDSEPIT